MSGTANPFLVRHKVFLNGDTADFHKDGYFLQNAGLTKDLRTAFVSVWMLTLNTVVFKLILLILRYFYQVFLAYTLIIQIRFFTLTFAGTPAGILTFVLQSAFSSIHTTTDGNSYSSSESQKHQDLVKHFFKKMIFFLFQTTARTKEKCTLLAKCHVGCIYNELSLVLGFISTKTDILLDGFFQFLNSTTATTKPSSTAIVPKTV